MSEATLKVRLIMIRSSILLPAFAFSQGDTLESWPETKQRMIERGQQYETAWAFYQSLESMAEGLLQMPWRSGAPQGVRSV